MSTRGLGPTTTLRPFDSSFFLRDPLDVAPELLNAILVTEDAVCRIVEVEAYRGEADPASHAFGGRTPRNRTMFGPPGHLYVYLSYGIHTCANVVCWPEGTAGAVLLRAAAPLRGLEAMRGRRGAQISDRGLCSGPGRLCQAMGIGRSLDGTDLLADRAGAVRLLRDGKAAPAQVLRGPRVGLGERVGEARSLTWRFAVPGDPNVSRPAIRPV